MYLIVMTISCDIKCMFLDERSYLVVSRLLGMAAIRSVILVHPLHSTKDTFRFHVEEMPIKGGGGKMCASQCWGG